MTVNRRNVEIEVQYLHAVLGMPQSRPHKQSRTWLTVDQQPDTTLQRKVVLRWRDSVLWETEWR